MKQNRWLFGAREAAAVFMCAAVLFGCEPEETAMTEDGGMPPTSSRLPPDPFAAVDELLQELELGTIAFTVPRSLNLRETAMVQLVLSLNLTVDELSGMIESAAPVESAAVRVSDRMQARLSGANFSISAITPETQAVSRGEPTQWRWEARPLAEGTHSLHLTLSALLRVDGESTARTIRTFDREIEVKVTVPQRLGGFLRENWEWLWTALLVPVGGWIWRRVRRGRRNSAGSTEGRTDHDANAADSPGDDADAGGDRNGI